MYLHLIKYRKKLRFRQEEVKGRRRRFYKGRALRG